MQKNDIAQVIKTCIWDKYATFKGRSSREEFFIYFIFFILFCLCWFLLLLWLVDFSGDLNLLDFVLLYIPVFLAPPLVSISARRLHDVSKTAWLLLLLLIPVINIFGFALLCMDGTKGANRFGPQPTSVNLRFWE